MLVKVFCLFRFSSSCIVLFPSNFLSFRFICFGLDLERRGFPRCLVIFRCLFMFNNQEPKIWCKAWSSWVVRCLLTVRVSVRWSGQAISLAISDVFSGFLPLGLADSIDTFQSSAGQRRPGQQLGPEGLWWWWDRWKESQHPGCIPVHLTPFLYGTHPDLSCVPLKSEATILLSENRFQSFLFWKKHRDRTWDLTAAYTPWTDPY